MNTQVITEDMPEPLNDSTFFIETPGGAYGTVAIVGEDGWLLPGVSGDLIWEQVREREMGNVIEPLSAHDARIRTLALAALDGEASDGYHTFDELYRYRMLYHAWAVRAWLAAGYRVVKSHRHADGEACFGGRYFVVYAMLPTGQVSNHYEDGYWDLFDCPEADKAPSYDGHTPQQAADRIHRSLTTTSKEQES